MTHAHARPLATGCCLIAILFAGASGCGSAISPDMTLAEAAAQIDLFNELTVGDAIQAFQQFVASGGVQPAGDLRPHMLPDDVAQLESLQVKLDSGEITQEQFDQEVRALLGDRAPGMAFGGFGFFGAPFGHHFGVGHRIADELQLTDEQIAQARDIFERLHTDIHQLRSDAHDRIRNEVLTEEQRAILDELWQDRMPGEPEATDAAADQGASRNSPRMHPGRGGPGFGHFGPRPGSDRLFLDRLAELLGLSDDQIAQIETIREELRTAIHDRHAQARDEFRAILTAEQQAVLDGIEARHGHAPDEDAAGNEQSSE